MEEILSNPLFWIFLTLVAFEIGNIIFRATKIPIFNPLLIAIIIIIVILLVFNIDYDVYNSGGKFINSFLGPATVVLAVPLYKNLDLLKKNIYPILVGLLVGSIVSVVCVILLSVAFGLNKELIATLVPKSVTTPIGVEVSKSLGGIEAITIVSIVFTGIVGAIIGALFAQKIESENLKKYFGIFLLLIAVMEIYYFFKENILNKNTHTKRNEKNKGR